MTIWKPSVVPICTWQLDVSPTGTRAVLVRGGPWPQDRDLWLTDSRERRFLQTHHSSGS